jgi:spore germination protein
MRRVHVRHCASDLFWQAGCEDFCVHLRPLLILISLLLVSACSYRTSVWVAPWEPASGTAVIENQARITEANPVWYALTADGGIETVWNGEDAAIRTAFATRRIIPTIQNIVGHDFDAAVVGRILADDAAMHAHVQALTNLVLEKNFDGIDIDYEGLGPEERDRYSLFVTILSDSLHQHRKRLSVTVSAKGSNDDTWKGPGAQDWKVIGHVADSVKIMAYDYHYPGGEAGPLAPLDWLRRIGQYAKQTMPSRKQIYGLPWYGYDWQGTKATNLTYPQALQLAGQKSAAIERDANGELHFHYDDHDVWFQDAESYRIKSAALIRQNPWIEGFAHWRSGSEDPGVWVEVENLKRHKIR